MSEIAGAVAAAQQLLASYQALHPEDCDPLAATPIDALVAWQRIAVERFHPADYPPGTLGWLEPGENLIWLTMTLDEPVRRFTLAHELGHWVLHRRAAGSASGSHQPASLPVAEHLACTAADVEAYLEGGAPDDELLRPGQSYSPRARREREADAFAAALLAPLDRVCALWLDLSQQAALEPERLANHFGITLKAMLGRMAEALYMPPAARMPRGTGTQGAGTARTAQPAVTVTRQVNGPLAATAATQSRDPWQQAAVASPTPALVVAGPGSGKTSTLVGRVRALVEEQGVLPRHILALTFSNKAAREMRERITGLLGAGAALPMVSTFHSFCAELLRPYAPQVGLRPDFALLDTPDSYFLLRRLAGRLPLLHYGHLSHPELHFATLLKAISRAKDELATPEDYLRLAEAALAGAQSDDEHLKAERAIEVARVYRVYQEALAAQGDADFGDLLLLAVRFLQATPAALAELHLRYQQVLVDEFQDINRASGVLLKLLAGEQARIWVVGDQDQAIYRFRGASPANIGQFHRDYPGAQVVPLSRNYRSLADIVAAAGAFREAALRLADSTPPGAVGTAADMAMIEEAIQPAGVSTAQQPVRPAPADPVITLATALDEQSEVAGLITAIQERHVRGIPYRDQVVLCRTREQARLVIESLERGGLPVGAGGSLLEQPDVKDVLAIVALLAEPSGMGLLRAATQPDHPIPRADLLALFAHAQREGIPAGILLWQPERLPTLSPEGFAGIMRLADILADLRATPDLWTLLARYVFISTRAAQRLLLASDPASSQRLNHLCGLLELARRFDAQERERLAGQPEGEGEGEAGKRWERFLEYLRVLIELRADDGGRREAEEGEEAEADLVRVLTVHASKGLEFPVVYLPQVARQKFPVSMHGEAAPLPPGLAEDETARSREDARAAHLLDEACLFYVAITRARDELILSHAERYKKRKAAPSDFLRHIETAPDVRLRRVRWEGAGLPGGATGVDGQQDAAGGIFREQGSVTAHTPALSAGELETYLRCPRQYEYRYVYSFQPAEQGYPQFYECVQRTMRVLHERFATSGAAGSGALAPEQASAAEASASAPDSSAPAGAAIYLEVAQSLFAEHWRLHGPLEHPFADAYYAHGLQVIERAWSELAGTPEHPADEAAPAHEQAPDTAAPVRLAASSRLSQRLDLRLDGQTIQVTIDRLEDEQVPLAGNPQRPVRLVRHRLGGKDGEKPEVEVRHILYALAQEQRAPGRLVEVYERNLSTGTLTHVSLDGIAARNRRADLAEALSGLRARRFPPKPNRRVCPRCPFFMICPAE